MNTDGNGKIIFTPVETKRASQLVYETIRDQILRAELKPGDSLPSERHLMRLCRRSHPTIREAMRMLESAGFIQVLPGNTSVVTHQAGVPLEQPLAEYLRYTRVPYDQIHEFIQSVEPELARLAVTRRDMADLTKMSQLLDLPDSSQPFDRTMFLDFHRILVQSTKNDLAGIIWDAVVNIMGNSGVWTDATPFQKQQEMVMLHRQLVQALETQDADRASLLTIQCWSQWEHEFQALKAKSKDSMSEITGLNMENHHQPEKQYARVSEGVYDQIRQKILSGELQAGDRLPPERELMHMVGRSRPTIREALRMLENNHYVTTARGSGTVVLEVGLLGAERSLQHLLQLNTITGAQASELRNICETVGAAWAAQRRTADDLAHLDGIYQKAMARLDDVRFSMECGRELNLALAKASHNQVMVVVSHLLTTVNYRLVAAFWEQQINDDPAKMVVYSRQIWQQHEKILAAIKQQDPEQAKAMTKAHIRESLEGV
jgi:GntR family transcriptional repressor for pyruvate dehydrogenase complex